MKDNEYFCIIVAGLGPGNWKYKTWWKYDSLFHFADINLAEPVWLMPIQHVSNNYNWNCHEDIIVFISFTLTDRMMTK